MSHVLTPDGRPQPVYDDEIDLRDLLRILWQQRRVIAVLAVIGAVLGVGASWLSSRYVSEGLFLLNAPVETYKRYESALFNNSRRAQFVQQFAASEREIAEAILRNIPLDALKEELQPEFGFTAKDAKTFGIENDQPGSLIGIRVRHAAREPAGSAPLLMLAEYVRDTVIRVDLESALPAQCTRYRTQEQTLRNAQIENAFAISQQRNRVDTLKQLIARAPAAGLADRRQVVAMEKDMARYLSPAAQLTAVEILIADMRLEETRRERERVASALKRDYYCAASPTLLEAAASGRQILDGLAGVLTQAFAGQDRTNDVVEQAWNELDLQQDNWRNRYLEQMRFIASPEGAEVKERKAGLVVGLLLGVIGGTMIGVFVAFAIGWWRGGEFERAVVSDR